MRNFKITIILMLFTAFSLYAFKPKQKTSDTFYLYEGTQNVSSRANPNNYRYSATNPCSGSGLNECGVMLAQDYGLIPNFSLVSFNTTTGMPDGGLDFIANYTKL